MSRVRVYISSTSIARYQAAPVWDTELETKQESGQVYYREEMGGKMRFGGSSAANAVDFDNINGIDKEACEDVTVEVEELCGATWTPRWKGVFNWLDVEDNQDECWVKVTPRPLDDYTCFNLVAAEVVNVFELDVVEITRAYDTVENLVFDTNTNGPLDLMDPYVEVLPPDSAAWCLPVVASNVWEEYTPANDPPYVRWVATIYQRIEGTGTCTGATPLPPGGDVDLWTLLTNGCPGSSTWWRCPGNESSNYARSPLKQGRWFKDVLLEIFASCGLSLVSDFFNINPDATAPANVPYQFAEDNLWELTFHQKSDVKRPYASDPAQPKQWEFKRQELLADLAVIFNIYYEIVGTTVRIEHQSYRDETGGYNATTAPQKLATEAAGDDKIKEEKFLWMDAEAVSIYFQGKPITYDCGTNSVERRATLISTDLTVIDSNDNTDILDAGFVLVATKTDGVDRFVIRDNRPLSWTELHDKLHRHHRRHLVGTLNGDPVTFTTTQGLRKQPAFTIPWCCADGSFPFNKRVETPLGAGVVEVGTTRLETQTLRLTLKY